jgi:hypothetical protein
LAINRWTVQQTANYISLKMNTLFRRTVPLKVKRKTHFYNKTSP